MNTQTFPLPLTSTFPHTWQKMVAIGVGALVLFASAQISIPLQPIPLTFQTTTAILLGLALGPRVGTAAVALYLGAAAVGLPVCANFSGGLHKFMGPTSGYLIGFLPAAYVSGWLASKGLGRRAWTSFIAAIPGTVIMFALGVTCLAAQIGWQQAWHFGVQPFLFTEVAKLAFASTIAPRFWR